MKSLSFAAFVSFAILLASSPTNAQWPGASDYDPDSVINQPLGGDAFVAPLVTVPFGQPLLPGRRARLFSGRAQAAQSTLSPAQYNQCIQDQSNDPVRAIDCSR